MDRPEDADNFQSVVSWQGHYGTPVAQADEYQVIACTACGFRHVVPLPSPEDLARAYREDYYRKEKPDYLAEAAEDADWAELTAADRLELFARLLGPQRRRLLDIGSGPGFFLKSATGRGWKATGIEPSHDAGDFARAMGCDVVAGFFDAESAPKLGRFDVVHLNNVLEHIPDPIALLTLARESLSEGGLICINVPNDFTPFQESGRAAAGAAKWWIAPPHHLNYFDFASAASLLERLGFGVREKTTSFPMEIFLMMGVAYIGNPKLGRACHQQRKRFDLAMDGESRRAFYRALAGAGIGREVVLIAQKAQSSDSFILQGRGACV
jgi:SAM-dependent methyltransferase